MKRIQTALAFGMLLALTVPTAVTNLAAMAASTGAKVGVEAHANLTPEQRKAKRAEMKAKWEAMTPEQRAEAYEKHHDRMKARFDAMSPEERAEHKAHMKAKWEGMTPEQKAEAKAKHEAWIKTLPADKQAEIRARHESYAKKVKNEG